MRIAAECQIYVAMPHQVLRNLWMNTEFAKFVQNVWRSE
jgi:hypothetical protein